MSLDDLVAAYGSRYDELRLGAGAAAEQLWLELGGPDDRRALEAAEAMLEVVNGAAAEAADLVDGYVAEYAGAVTGRPRPPSVSPLDVADYVVDKLRGTPGVDVYRRPAVELRRLLAEGRPYDDALAQAGRRVSGMAEADVALAHRAAGSDAMTADPDVDGYRRVLTGASCLLCSAASTQRYRTGDLMPIHTRCDCRVAPIIGGTDYGRIVNRDLYLELKRSGQLDKLNRSNAGRSGPARARAAATNRARQEQLAGIGRGVQPELELGRPPSAGTLADELGAGAGRRVAPVAAVAQHGELGPVLVDGRHAYTSVTPSRAGRHRLDDDLETLRRTDPPPPASVRTVAGVDPPSAPPELEVPAPPAPAPPRARYSVDSPEVQRAARRRNLPPERVAEELNAKAARRSAEAADARAYRRSLSVDHPDVIRAAEKAGVSPDEVLVAHAELGAVRREIADDAARHQAEIFGELERKDIDALKIAAPRKTAEYDWLEQVDARERARLSRLWYDQNPARVLTPDVLAQRLENAFGREYSSDEAAQWWLDRTRRYEAAGALRRGKLPSARAYSQRIDVDELVGGHYRPSRVVGVDDLDAAAYIAHRNRELLAADALDYLEASANPVHGPAPYRMSYASWEAELRELEWSLRYGEPGDLVELDVGADELLVYTREAAEARYAELVPRFLDEPGTSYEELYARIVTTAQRAGEEVPAHARIPWAD